MSEMEYGAGARPARGIGPREGVRAGAVWPVPVDPLGIDGPTPDAARGRKWRRSSRGLYVPADVDRSDVHQRIVEAAALLHEGGGVTGWAGLSWLGAVWLTGLEGDGATAAPVPLAVGRNHPMREQSGFLLSNAGVPRHHQLRVDGVRVTTPLRSLTFEMRRSRTVLEATKWFAMAAYDDLVSINELAAFVERELNAKTGVATVRAAIPLLTENAWSPMEPEMFHRWVASGRPAPLFNVPVFDRLGRHVATPDLLDPVSGVCGEYAGDVHLRRAQRAVDVGREGVVRRLGLEPVTMVAADRWALEAFTQRLHDAYERAERLPASERRWTIEQPSWWIDTSTVARRRALSESQRRVALTWRRTAA